MKDYSLNEEEKSRFIKKVIYHNNHTFDIVFADGSRLNGIDENSENLSKVKRVLEEQARKGVSNYSVFQGKKTCATVATGISALTLAVAGTWACSIPAISDVVLKEPPIAAICGVSALTILGTMPSIVKMVKNSMKVDELDKIKYRNLHQRELDAIRDYPNSLNGVNSSLKELISVDKEPFSMLYVDEYSIDDLETIVSNVEKEESYQFTYKVYKKGQK